MPMERHVWGLDPLKQLHQHRIDAFGLHPHKVRSRLGRMVIAQVVQQHGALGRVHEGLLIRRHGCYGPV
jgi:hypothetical protein